MNLTEVAQTSGLLYRRLPACRRRASSRPNASGAAFSFPGAKFSFLLGWRFRILAIHLSDRGR